MLQGKKKEDDRTWIGLSLSSQAIVQQAQTATAKDGSIKRLAKQISHHGSHLVITPKQWRWGWVAYLLKLQTDAVENIQTTFGNTSSGPNTSSWREKLCFCAGIPLSVDR